MSMADRRSLTDADVVTFVLAGCNAAEIAAYAGTDEQTAKARIAHARMDIARQGAEAGA
jgi:DNA-directed RNA polymerase specialized sigma24 family protein